MFLRYKTNMAESTNYVDPSRLKEALKILGDHGLGSSKSNFTIHPESPDDSRALMRHFSVSWQETGTVSPTLMEWAARCFEAIVEGKATDKNLAARSFQLSHPFGHRPTKNTSRDLEIASHVKRLREQGWSLESAVSSAAENFKIDESNAKKIYLRKRRNPFL